VSGQRLIWLDLETTGLDPRDEHIIEIAMAEATVADPFTITRRFEALVWSPRDPSCLDPVVREMHEKSGLLALQSIGLPGAYTVEGLALVWLGPVAEDATKPMLAGRNVGFDRSFLQAHMTRLARRFHHHLWDVSSHEQLARHLGMPALVKRWAHRAAADIDEAIEHSRAICAWLSGRRAAPGVARRVFVASPFAGRGRTDAEREDDSDENIAYAIRCQGDAIARGESPYVPHLALTHSLDDSDPSGRERGLALALAMLAGCEVLAVYEDRGVSGGMRGEIAEAERLGIPVEMRRIGVPRG